MQWKLWSQDKESFSWHCNHASPLWVWLRRARILLGDNASIPSLSRSQSLISCLLSNTMYQASVAIFQALFLFIALQLGNGPLNKGSSPRPSSMQHANKYSSQCLSNVIVNHLSLLPSHGSVILLAPDFHLLSQASAAFGVLHGTTIIFVPFIRFAVSHFPKVSGTHFSTTLFLCSRKKKKSFWKQQKHSSKGHRVTSSLTWSLFISGF